VLKIFSCLHYRKNWALGIHIKRTGPFLFFFLQISFFITHFSRMRSSFITLTFAVTCILGSSLASPVYVKRDTGLGETLNGVGGTAEDIVGNGVLGDNSLIGGNAVQGTVGGATETTSDIHDPLSKRDPVPDISSLSQLFSDPKLLELIHSYLASGASADSAAPAATKRDLPIGAVTDLTGDLPLGGLTGLLGESPASTDSPASTSDASTDVDPSVKDGQAIHKRGPADEVGANTLVDTATDLTSGTLDGLPVSPPVDVPATSGTLNGIAPALASASDAANGGLPSLPLGGLKDKSDTTADTAPAAPADAAKPDHAESDSK
jgi:hypothetical protein